MTNKTDPAQRQCTPYVYNLNANVLPMDVNVYILKKAPLAASQRPADPKIGTVPDGFPMEFHIERAGWKIAR
jgi:hypothetical protein